MPEGDGAGFFDLLQGAGQFIGENWSTDQSNSDSCAQKLGNDAHQIISSRLFFLWSRLADSRVLRTAHTTERVGEHSVQSVEHDSCQALGC